MPNHCDNEVYISFKDRETTKKFLEFVKGKDEQGGSTFTLTQSAPLPNGKWDYDWKMENWVRNGIVILLIMVMNR